MTRTVKRSASPHWKSKSQLNYFNDQTLFGQVTAFKKWLGLIHSQGIHHDEYTPIPYELVDFTASFIASMMHGISSDLILMTSNLMDTRSYRENVNFIRKTLSRAKVSCSSLICSLWYIDQFHQMPWCKMQWTTKDLFLASIVVAEKYIADVTWLNSDWAEWTQFSYSTEEINQLEKRLLSDLNYKLYISEFSYINFVRYLEFRLHSRQLLGGDVLLLSYRDIDVLSQSLNPMYVERLQLKIRPFEAMVLLAKQAISIFVMYTATLATIASTGYILSHSQILHDLYTLLEGKEDDIAMMILTCIDFYKSAMPPLLPGNAASQPPYYVNGSCCSILAV